MSPFERVTSNFYYKKLIESLIEDNPDYLELLPDELMNKEFCTLAVQLDGMVLRYVPEALIDKALCKLAIQQYGAALSIVPEGFRDEELYTLAVQKHGW